MPWHHISPIPRDPGLADIRCSNLQLETKFFVAGDFDSDGLTELVVAPAASGSRGNDLWVMKYNIAAASWQHMAPIPDHPMDADIDCSGRKFPARFAVVADDVDDDDDELIIAAEETGGWGSDHWLMMKDDVNLLSRKLHQMAPNPVDMENEYI